MYWDIEIYVLYYIQGRAMKGTPRLPLPPNKKFGRGINQRHGGDGEAWGRFFSFGGRIRQHPRGRGDVVIHGEWWGF